MELRKIVGRMPKSEIPEFPIDMNWQNHNIQNKFEIIKNILLWLLSLLVVVVSYIAVNFMTNY